MLDQHQKNSTSHDNIGVHYKNTLVKLEPCLSIKLLNNLLYFILRLEDIHLEPLEIIYKKKDQQSLYYKVFSRHRIHILCVINANVGATPEKFHESWQCWCKLWKKRYLKLGSWLSILPTFFTASYTQILA